MTQPPDEPQFAPELIGVVPHGFDFWHSCPLCGGNMTYSGGYDALVCIHCGFIVSIEDMLVYETDVTWPGKEVDNGLEE